MGPVIAGAALLVLVFALGGEGGKKTNGNGPKKPVPPGGGKPKPGDKPVPGKTNPGHKPKGGGHGGGQYGSGDIPLDFDWEGNQLFIGTDCDVVAEAKQFMPSPEGGVNACEYDNLAATLEDPDNQCPPQGTNTVYGYIDFMIDQLGMDDPIAIATQILVEAAPFCADLPEQLWPEPLVDWWNGFVERVVDYHEEATGIPFEPE